MTGTGAEREDWKPDFLMVGAMKSGTTSLYTELKNHPDVYMPELEVGFFDIDDIRQHPDFFKMCRGDWHYHSYQHQHEELVRWYRSLFDDASEGAVRGERSTTYMASSVAPRRIKDAVPDARLIFMLRDPVPRAYSNYWHLLRSGEATGSFEHTLRYRHSALFDRGLYRSQIERYMSLFDREQLKFLVFEQFVREPEKVLEEVCEFIAVDAGGLRTGDAELEHRNRGRYPWSMTFQYALNRGLFHGLLDGHRYLNSHLPALRYEALGFGPVGRLWHEGIVFALKALSRINCSRRANPVMKDTTRRMLTDLYEDRNRGLSELIGRNLSEWWDYTDV